MTSAQELKRVAIGSILVLAVYSPAATYLQRTYVSQMAPPPPGAVRQIFQLRPWSAHGVGFIEGAAGYRRQGDFMVYEDDRPLRQIGSMQEVDTAGGGTFAQENGVGIVLSASDNSDPRKNPYRYWVVRPPQSGP